MTALLICLGGSTNVMAAGAGNGTIRTTCIEDGKVVHRGHMQINASQDRRDRLMKEFPDAMCAFLEVKDDPAEAEFDLDPSSSAMRYSFDVGDASIDSSLAVALAAIAEGKSIAPAPAATKEGQFKPLNLVLGIYHNMTVDDVMAHWTSIKTGSPTLSRMTPSVATVDDIISLSVENVPDAVAADLCREAEGRGLGCIAFY